MIADIFYGLAFGMGGLGSAILGKLADLTTSISSRGCPRHGPFISQVSSCPLRSSVKDDSSFVRSSPRNTKDQEPSEI